MKKWSQKWLLQFQTQKCSIMRIGRSDMETFQYSMEEELNTIKVEKVLGVVIYNELKFTTHYAEKINKANRIVGLMIRAFTALDETIFRALFVALVRPHLEYANQVWCPYKKKAVEVVEALQRRATKLVPTLKNLPYQDRLRKLDLPALAYRRSRGDMVETFKIMNCVYDRSVSEVLFMEHDGLVTRGHEKRIFKQRPRLDIRKY